MKTKYQVNTWIIEAINKDRAGYSTRDGMDALGLSHDPEHYQAGNMYNDLIMTIKKLLEERDGRPY